MMPMNNLPAPFSRRNFLKTALLAGSAPLVLPSGIWGAETAPSRQITLGFIGMGKQSQHLLSSFLWYDYVRVLAVCDVDRTRREAAKAKVEKHYVGKPNAAAYKGCADYEDFRQLLARKDIDAVVIATPDHWHAIIGIAAAEAGKDIYCEKPLTHNIHEARALVQVVRKNDRVFQVGSMQRSSGEFFAAASLVRNGVIGKVRRAEVSVSGPAVFCGLPAEPAEPGLNWDFWLGPAPIRPYNSVLSPRGVHTHFPDWRRYREYGGGGVTDWGAHHFDIVQWALGYDDSGPVEFFPAPGPNAQSGVRFRYDNGVEVVHAPGNGIVFHGEKGRLEVNRGKFALWLGAEQKAESPAQCNEMLKELLPPNAVRLYRSDNHLTDWLKSIRTRKPPICDVEVGARTVTICHLVNLAYYHGQRMKWDPAKEQFTGGTGDPKWLTRDYRGAWKVA